MVQGIRRRRVVQPNVTEVGAKSAFHQALRPIRKREKSAQRVFQETEPIRGRRRRPNLFLIQSGSSVLRASTRESNPSPEWPPQPGTAAIRTDQLPQKMEPEQLEAYQHNKGQLQQVIENRRQQIGQLKAQRKAVAKHIEIKDLPVSRTASIDYGRRKNTLSTPSSSSTYRAETALAQLARDKIMARRFPFTDSAIVPH